MFEYRSRIAVLLSILIIECMWIAAAHAADFNVLRNGAPAFCAPALVVSGSTYDFRGDCGVTPPPDDASQLKRATVTYHEGIAQNVDVTQFGNLWGRASAADPIKPWPFASGSEPLVTLPPGKHIRATMLVGAASEGHALKGEMYASDHGPVYVKVYENGVQIFYADRDGRGQPLDFNNQPWVYFTFGAGTAQKCKVVAGHTYEIEYGYKDASRGGRTRTHWN